MSKYGTITASSSPAPTPEGGGSTPGSCAGIRYYRPWRELADLSALSVPGGFADAYHRARANLAYFAYNYKLVFVVVLSVCLLWTTPFRPSIVLPCFFTTRSKVFPVHLTLTLLLLVLLGDTASVLVSLPAGLVLLAVHAVLRLPMDMDSVDEEAGRCSTPELPCPSTN